MRRTTQEFIAAGGIGATLGYMFIPAGTPLQAVELGALVGFVILFFIDLGRHVFRTPI